MGKNNKRVVKSGNNSQLGKVENQKEKEKISFSAESNVDEEKMILQDAQPSPIQNPSTPKITENSDQKKEMPKASSRFNAFQRLLIKLGSIKIPDEPDPGIEEAWKNKVKDLEQEIAKIDKKLHDNEEGMKDCIFTLDPDYCRKSVDPSQLSKMLKLKITNLKQSSQEKLADLDKLKATENPKVNVEPLSLQDLSYNKIESVSGAANGFIRSEKFEDFQRKELEEKNKLRNEKNDLQRKYDLLNEKVSLNKSRIESLEDELKRSEQKSDSLKAQLSQIQTKLDEETEAHKKLSEDKDQILKKKSETQKRLSEVLEDNKQLRASDIGKVTKRLEDAQVEIANLKNIISDYEITIENKYTEIKSLNNTIESKEADYMTLTGAKKEVDSKLKETEVQLEYAREEINRANNTINRQVKEIERNANIIKEKNELIEDKISELNDLDKKLNISTDKLNAAHNEIERQKGIVATRDQKIISLNGKIDSLTSDLVDIKKDLSSSQKTASESVKDFYMAVIKEAEATLEVLNEGKYELGHGEMGETCTDDEDVNKHKFNKLVKRLKEIKPTVYKTVGDLRIALLAVLSEEVNKEAEGIITPLARLCAYSRLPFMREDQGEDYMRLDPKRLGRLEQYLKGMLALVGIELIIPTPFCDTVHEGDFEARPGEIPNLDYICPNARQHIDKVDRFNTEDIITDIVCVGYRIPGQTDQKAKVIL